MQYKNLPLIVRELINQDVEDSLTLLKIYLYNLKIIELLIQIRLFNQIRRK